MTCKNISAVEFYYNELRNLKFLDIYDDLHYMQFELPQCITSPHLLQILKRYSSEWVVEIKDITDFVKVQHKFVRGNKIDLLFVAEERVYPVSDPATAAQIRLDNL